MRAPSVISNKYECLLCKRDAGLHCHHVYEGSRRTRSDEAGLWVWLCDMHHRAAHETELGRMLKERVQFAYERTHTREEFMRITQKNYL